MASAAWPLPRTGSAAWWCGVCGVCVFPASVLLLWLLLTLGYPAGPTLQAAPSFDLADAAGRTHRLEDYRGKPVVLLFLPELNGGALEGLRSVSRGISMFDRTGIKVFSIVQADADAVRAVAERERPALPLLADPGGVTARRFRQAGVPDGLSAAVIGRSGRILEVLRHPQPERLGEQVMTLAECCLVVSFQASPEGIGEKLDDPRLFPSPVAGATVLLFVSAECPCSRGYDERIRALAADYAGRGVRVVAVNPNEQEWELPAVAEHAGLLAIPYRRDDGALVKRLKASVSPEAFVFDRNRVLRYRGRIDDSRSAEAVKSNDLRNALDAVIQGYRPPKPATPAFGCILSPAAA